jgi:hypothetical protein
VRGIPSAECVKAAVASDARGITPDAFLLTRLSINLAVSISLRHAMPLNLYRTRRFVVGCRFTLNSPPLVTVVWHGFTVVRKLSHSVKEVGPMHLEIKEFIHEHHKDKFAVPSRRVGAECIGDVGGGDRDMALAAAVIAIHRTATD